MEWWKIGNCVDHPVADKRMSKRRKNNRQDNLPKSAALKRRFSGAAVVFLAVAIAILD